MSLAPLFSPSGDSLALASSDGLIRIYDSGSGRLKATLGQGDSKTAKNAADGLLNGHLVEQHTSMVWATSGRKKKKATSWTSLLVVGTASGDVKAYDPSMGELKWRSTRVIDGPVATLAYNEHKAGVVLAAGSTGLLVSLSLENGEKVESFQASKHAITCLAMAPDGKHVFGGGSSLSLWQLASQERTAKFTGHAVPASCAVFASGSSVAASVCPGDRHVALWSASAHPAQATPSGSKPSKHRKSQRPAAATLPMQQPPVQLDACPHHADEHMGNGLQGNGTPAAGRDRAQFCVCAVSEGGEACVWVCEQQGIGEESEAAGRIQGSLLATVQVGAQSGSSGLSDKVLAAKLLPGASGTSLLVARGSSARPVFETVPLPATPPATPTTITLAPSTGGVLLPGKASAAGAAAAEAPSKASQSKVARKTGPEVTVVGPGDATAPAPLLRTAQVSAPTGATDVVMTQAQDGDAAAEESEEEDEAPEAQVPLGERVAALEAAAGVRAAAGGEAAGAADGAAQGPVASDKANSLAVLMTQALRSNDRVLLERCLSATNPAVIHNTVARLLPVDAASFLRAAVDRLMSSPARAGQLAPWIKAVLMHHTGYIMSAPGAQAPLAALYQAIDARVSVYSQLLRLHGRLSLVTTHARMAADAATGAGSSRPEPEVVFEDEEVGDGDVEDPFAVTIGEGSDEDSDGAGQGSEDWDVEPGEDSDGGSDLGDDDDDMGSEDDDDDDL